MVEGHGVHRVAQAHRRALVGKKFKASSPNGRFVDGARAIDDKALARVEAIGKNLFYFFDRGEGGRGGGSERHGHHVMHVHFGMSGRFSVHAASDPPAATPTTRLKLEGHGRVRDAQRDGRRPHGRVGVRGEARRARARPAARGRVRGYAVGEVHGVAQVRRARVDGPVDVRGRGEHLPRGDPLQGWRASGATVPRPRPRRVRFALAALGRAPPTRVLHGQHPDRGPRGGAGFGRAVDATVRVQPVVVRAVRREGVDVGHGQPDRVLLRRELSKVDRIEIVRRVLYTGPHTTASARWTPILKDFARRISPPTPRFQSPSSTPFNSN